jgi:hypothetical protein
VLVVTVDDDVSPPVTVMDDVEDDIFCFFSFELLDLTMRPKKLPSGEASPPPPPLAPSTPPLPGLLLAISPVYSFTV